MDEAARFHSSPNRSLLSQMKNYISTVSLNEFKTCPLIKVALTLAHFHGLAIMVIFGHFSYGRKPLMFL